MTKFLFTTLPTNDLGLLTRSLPIAREVAALGHKVVFSSPAKAPRKLISESGFQNLLPEHPIYDFIEVDWSLRGVFGFLFSNARSRQHGRSPFETLRKLITAFPVKSSAASQDIWDMDHAGAAMGMLNEGFVRANCEAFLEVLKASSADILVDFWNPFAVIAARALGKPVVTVIQADAHPESSGFIWWKPRPRDLPSPIPAVNRVLKGYGLPKVTKLADLSLGDLTLVMGMPELDPLPESVHARYIGCVLWQNANAVLPAWVSRLSNLVPTIWVYSGNPKYSVSSLDSMVVLEACVEALASEKVQVVLTTGHQPLPKRFLPLPANFRHEPYLPGLLMAERSDLLIHHGGYGSCQTGLYAGKPAVILPTYSERLSNARRLSDGGAAEIVPVCYVSGQKHVNAQDLRDAVRRVVREPSYAWNARRLGARLRSLGGPAKAAEYIEEFAMSFRD